MKAGAGIKVSRAGFLPSERMDANPLTSGRADRTRDGKRMRATMRRARRHGACRARVSGVVLREPCFSDICEHPRPCALCERSRGRAAASRDAASRAFARDLARVASDVDGSRAEVTFASCARRGQCGLRGPGVNLPGPGRRSPPRGPGSALARAPDGAEALAFPQTGPRPRRSAVARRREGTRETPGLEKERTGRPKLWEAIFGRLSGVDRLGSAGGDRPPRRYCTFPGWRGA